MWRSTIGINRPLQSRRNVINICLQKFMSRTPFLGTGLVCCGLGRHFARQADVQGIQCLALFVNVMTGHTLYYVSPNLVRQILGLDEPERDALVQLLIDHGTRPQRIYRHRWSPGDLLVWDYHALMHSPTDVSVYLQEQRLMHRSFTDSPTDEAATGAAAQDHRAADEAADAPRRARRRGGGWIALLGRRPGRFGLGPRAPAAAGRGVYLPHCLRPARRAEGFDGARCDAARRRAHPSALRRPSGQQRSTRACAAKRTSASGWNNCAGPLPDQHWPTTGSDQPRRAGRAQTQDRLARRHHPHRDVAAGVHAATGCPGERRAPFRHPCRGPGCT